MSATTYRSPEPGRLDYEYDRLLHPSESEQRRRDEWKFPSLSRFEAVLVFAVFTIAYFLIGLHLVGTSHVVVFDAVDRLTRAYMTWWDSPPKLAAIGFVYPPLQSLVFLPFALLKPLATSLVALPLVGALFGALTMVSLDGILVRCELALPLRLITMVLFGIGPLWLWATTTGESEAVYGFLFAAMLASFVAWYLTEETRFLIGCGLAAAVAALTRYNLGILAAFLALLIAGVLVRRRSAAAQVEGTVAAYGAPIIYALAIWTMFNWLIQGKPFGWLSTSANLAVNSAGLSHTGGASISAILSHAVELTATTSPLAIAAFVVLLFLFVAGGNTMAVALASVIGLTVIQLGLEAAIPANIASMTLRTVLPVTLAGVIGAAWIYRAAGSLRLLVFGGMTALLVAALPLTWSEMKSYPFQEQEQAFTRGLFSGADQSGASSRGGFTVGLEAERQMADYINRTVGDRFHAVLTDNSQTYAVILLSGKAPTFFNRVDRGDGAWRSVLSAPYGRVQYLLIACQDSGDLIRQKYPGACTGRMSSRLTPVFTTVGQRYTLVRVAGPTPGGGTSTGGTSTGTVQNASPTQSQSTNTTP
ncbi:MAG TPA: hypothetical protein VMU90_10060 [Solirubrobacteraceae bacterium]|nr:hypothetical protein [Solirubrobacteraceae bacterium]